MIRYLPLTGLFYLPPLFFLRVSIIVLNDPQEHLFQCRLAQSPVINPDLMLIRLNLLK